VGDTPVTSQNEFDEKKDVRKKDLFFAGVMLTVYTVCCIIFVSVTAIWIKEDKKIANANSTKTEIAIITEQANATVTAVARVTEQAQYEFVDSFDENKEGWLVTSYNNDFFTGSSTIYNGVYTWDILKVSKTFVYSTDTNRGIRIKDFDVYVDTKIVNTESGKACSGFAFRKPGARWNGGSYIFSVCNDSNFNIYHKKNDWDTIAYGIYDPAIKNDDWNRIEVSARGDQFTFIVNNVVVYELTDDRQPFGRLELYIEVNRTNPVSILFDNFGFQPR